ncbi:MAG: hypothetical protein CTY24_12840 [Methylobacter sp.]|nr:MAG: hypothetical protein CTY24_12840 [Methylobacter sp.]
MDFKLPFEFSKPLAGEATEVISLPIQHVFLFVGEHFFQNYPKWALEVSYFELLDGPDVRVGAKAKQIRSDEQGKVASVLAVKEYQPVHRLIVEGIDAPFLQAYVMTEGESYGSTKLTFRFELMEVEMFMRPFEKLIRYAIEEGAENTVKNIKNLVMEVQERVQ